MADTIVQVRVNFRVQGELAQCVLHYHANPGSPENDWTMAEQVFANTIQDGGVGGWRSELLNCLSQDTHISAFSCRQILPYGGNRRAEGFTPLDFVGNIAAPAFNSEVAAILNMLSLTNPGKMGRIFLPGVATTSLDGGRWVGGAVTNYNDFANKVNAGFTEAGTFWAPVIYNAVDQTWRTVYQIFHSGNVGQMSQRGRGE